MEELRSPIAGSALLAPRCRGLRHTAFTPITKTMAHTNSTTCPSARASAVLLRFVGYIRPPTGIASNKDAEAGFTLIELMVVLLIIAILLAIAIPTFLGVTNTAGDRASQSNLTNALTEAKVLYQVNQVYTGTAAAFTAGNFSSQAPEFNWQLNTACLPTTANCVSVQVFGVSSATDAQGLSLALDSKKTNTCWYAFDLESSNWAISGGGTFPSGGVFYGKKVMPSTGCVALNPDADSGVTGFSSGQGQNYGNAVTVS
jgi:prepilin-type N-terminal cleavage/methylation domain-containing protein